MKKCLKFLAVILCVSIMLTSLPVLAKSGGETPIQTEKTEETAEPTYIYEIKEKRTSNTKTFLMSDRTETVAVYNAPVHYLKDGVWEDVDNSFSSQDENTIENAKNDFKTKFAKKSNKNHLVELSKNGYEIKWSLPDCNKVEAEYTQQGTSDDQNISALKNISGTVLYKGILSDTDIGYNVSAAGLKENILLNSPAAPRKFTFNYEYKDLNCVKEDSKILFCSKDGETVFELADFYMYDSARNASDNIEIKVEETKNGVDITIIPDEEWLTSAERAWPITIDPGVVGTQRATDIWDIDIQSGQTSAFNYKAADMLVGSNGPGTVCRTLIKFKNLPNIGENSVIVNARINLTAYPGPLYGSYPSFRTRPTDKINVCVHRMTANWPEIGATWGGYGNSYNSTVEDYFIYNNTDYSFGADITKLVSGWYNSEYPNYGVMIKAESETAANHIMQFTSSDFELDDIGSNWVTWRPALIINYRNCTGLEDYWSYTTQNMGGYGTGYVNNYNGNLTYIHNDASYNSLIDGFTLSHVYNTSKANSAAGRYGKGWGLNLVQTFEPVTIENNSAVKYVYTDGDGTKHYFVQTDDGSIVDEDGLGYTFTKVNETTDSGTTPILYKITTKDNTVLKFDQWYALRRIIDTNGNTINLTYSPVPYKFNYLTSVTTTSGGSITLNYDSNYTLTSITDNAGRVTEFSYTNGNLTQITYPDKTGLEFEYCSGVSGVAGSTSWLQGVKLPNGYQYRYGNYNNGRIYMSAEQAVSGTQTNKYYYTYANNKTNVRDLNDRSINYLFDNFGRVTCAYDSQGNSYSETYTPVSTKKDGIFANNKINLSSNNIRNINNLITNPVFSDGMSSWAESKEAPNETQFSVVSDQSYISSKSVKITSTASSIQVLAQTPAATAGKTYTLSANIKTENVVSATHGAGVEIVTSSSSGNRHYYSDFILGTTDTEINNGFTTVTATAKMASDEKIVKITAGLYNASGTVWIDSIQLEEGDTANKINMLSNSGFENNTGSSSLPTGYQANFTAGAAGASSSADKHSGSYSLKIVGNANVKRYAYQMINLNGKKGDVYSMGGWAKANAVPTHSTTETDFKLTAGIYYTDGTYAEFPFTFNLLANDWQYLAGNFITKKDYNKIQIYCSYNFNANTAYFDDIFLYRDTAQSFTYDKDGNVVSTADYAKQESTFEYKNNSLSKIINPTGTYYEYSYDSNNNLIFSKCSEGLQTKITYDSFGNPTSTDVSSNIYSASLQAGKTYFIRLCGSGKYLTVENEGTSSGTNVIQSDYTGKSNQKWKLVKNAEGLYNLCPVSAPNLALNVANASDSDLTNIQVSTVNNANSQALSFSLNSNFTYSITPKSSASGKLVSVNTSSLQNNVTIINKNGNENPDQSWYFEDISKLTYEKIEDGSIYAIRVRKNGKYVDFGDDEAFWGATLFQQWFSGGVTQKYIIEKYKDTEYYTIVPAKAPDRPIKNYGNADPEENYLYINSMTNIDECLYKLEYSSKYDGFYIIPKTNENTACVIVGSGMEIGDPVAFTKKKDSIDQIFVLEKISQSMAHKAYYQKNGFIGEQIDNRGIYTFSDYDSALGLQTSYINGNGDTTDYTYDERDRLKTVSIGNSKVEYNYNIDGTISSILSPSGSTYKFTYNERGQRVKSSVGGHSLASYEYDPATNNLLRVINNNTNSSATNTTIEYAYDTLDRVISKSYNGEVGVTYKYDNFGMPYSKDDILSGVKYNYLYDLSGRSIGVNASNKTSLRFVYDDYSRIIKQVFNFNTKKLSTEYVYGDTEKDQSIGFIYGIKQNGKEHISYSYDELARLSQKSLNTASPYLTKYEYLPGYTPDTTSTLVKAVENGADRFEYKYDAVGNITEIKQNGTVTQRYSYDDCSQLKSATYGGDTYTYEYDGGGNLTYVKKNGEIIKEYSYGYNPWPDLLTSYNGQPIVHTFTGNPTKYRDDYNFTWQNDRWLSSVTQGEKNISYSYDSDGLRTSKNVNGTVTDYYWLNGILKAQKTGEEYIIFLYDENGIAYGMLVSDGTSEAYYYYLFNAQGDVVGIIDETGTQVVSYEYGPWGDLLSVTGTLADTIGQQNPLRYHGYYYDTETGFYYLQSRYYDPEVCRFINADNQIADVGGQVLGYNMFVYCMNNPVNMNDSTGNWPRWITATVAAVATVVAVVATVVSAPVVVVATAATVAVVSAVAYVAQSHHYDKRKEKNTNLPQTPQEAKKLGWLGPDTTPKGPVADCHQYTSPDKSNVKYVSPDGYREVIYNSVGNIVLDSRDIGTYNFCPSGGFWGNLGHLFADILPWWFFGNDDDDPGPLANKIIRLFE